MRDGHKHTHQVLCQRNGDEDVADRGCHQPKDHRDLKLLKLAEVRDEVDGNRRREAARGADEC